MAARAYELVYDRRIEEDLRPLPRNLQDRITRAIRKRLETAPDRYGARLRKSLAGYWKLRVGDYRVVYLVVGREVRILKIGHREDAYEAVLKRILGGFRPAPSDG